MENHYKAWKKSFLEYNIVLTEKEYYPLEGTKLKKIAENILIKNGIKENLADLIVKKKENYYTKNIKIKFYKDVVKIINYLKKDYLLGIVTATKRNTFEKTISDNFKKNLM